MAKEGSDDSVLKHLHSDDPNLRFLAANYLNKEREKYDAAESIHYVTLSPSDIRLLLVIVGFLGVYFYHLLLWPAVGVIAIVTVMRGWQDSQRERTWKRFGPKSREDIVGEISSVSDTLVHIAGKVNRIAERVEQKPPTP